MYFFKSDLSTHLLHHYFIPKYYKKENINISFLNKLIDKFFISTLFNDELHRGTSNKIDKYTQNYLQKFGKLEIDFEEDLFRQSYCLSIRMTKYRKTYFSVNITIHRNGYFIVDKMIERSSASHRLLKNEFMGYFSHHNNHNLKTVNIIYDFTYRDYCNIDNDYNAYLIKDKSFIPLQEVLSINDENMTIEYIYDSDFNNTSIRYMLFFNRYRLNIQKVNNLYHPMFNKKEDSYFRDISEITSNYLNEKEIDMRLISEDDLEVIAMIDC